MKLDLWRWTYLSNYVVHKVVGESKACAMWPNDMASNKLRSDCSKLNLHYHSTNFANSLYLNYLTDFNKYVPINVKFSQSDCTHLLEKVTVQNTILFQNSIETLLHVISMKQKVWNLCTPTLWLTQIHFTLISLTGLFKGSHSSINTSFT